MPRTRTRSHDFGHDILPKLLGRFKMCAYNFVDENKQKALYWRDVGTLEAYYEANMDRGRHHTHLSIFTTSPGPCEPVSYQYPHRRSSSLASPAAPAWPSTPSSHPAPLSRALSSATSVLSQDVRVNSYADVDSSIIFSHVNIGRHCRIRHAIIDRDVHIPDGTVIGYDVNEDKKNYFVTPSGLTIVTRDYSVYENPVSPEFLLQGQSW